MVARPEYIDEIVERLRRATELNWQTPARRGNVIVLDESNCEELMVTGDLHGHRGNYNRIRRIASLDEHRKRHLVLQEVVHGGPTYDDGGCMSHMLLEEVARLKAEYPERVHFLLSNHELSEASDYLIRKGSRFLNVQFRLGMERMYGPDTERVRKAYSEFILSCPLAVQMAQGLFVSHSIPADADRFDRGVFWRRLTRVDISPGGGAFRLVWDRDYSQQKAAAFAQMVAATAIVIGHEP